MKTEWRSRLRSASALPADPVELGRFIGVFGIKGELRLHLDNRESDLLANGLDVFLRDDSGPVVRAVVRTRPGTNGRVLASVAGIDSRELAVEMVGVSLHVDRASLPELADDEYYLVDLIGLNVRCGDVDYGSVVDVHGQGPVDVIELDGDRYLPSTNEHIEGIDFESGILYIVEGSVAV